MKKNLIVPIIAGIAVAEVSRILTFSNSYSLKARNFKFKVIRGELFISFIMDLNNKSSKSVEIEKIVGNIKESGKVIGQFSTSSNAYFKPNAITSIPLTIKLTGKNLAEYLKDFTASAEKIIELDYKVFIKFKILGLVGLPIGISQKDKFNLTNMLADVINWVSKFKNA